MKHNQRIGKWGEEIAAGYLTQRSAEIVTRNARTPYGEIDIVVRQGDITIFIEVKTRTSDKMGMPEDSITARKRLHMLSAAEHYAMEHEIDHWQIDVISIEGKPGMEPKITHFENAVT
ncbi:MAG TPA: YraN family protein [Anaerolineales bacterium]|nr:YraN family protein [Anaerolineales bacterium]